MSQPPRFHVWMPDGRTLCDLKSRAEVVEVAEGNPQGYKACGACFVASEMISEIITDLVRSSPGIQPDAISALKSLRRSRWATIIDIDGMVVLATAHNYSYEASRLHKHMTENETKVDVREDHD